MQCRICGNREGNRRFEVKEMMFGLREIFQYFQCSQCDCLQIETVPRDMSRYCPGEYYSFQVQNINRFQQIGLKVRNRYALFNKGGAIGKALYARYPNAALRSLSFIPLKKASSILDVGCGVGKLLYFLRISGFKNLLGVDPYIERDIKYKNGLIIQKKSLNEVEGEWDVIMLHHSFEHIADPEDSLTKISNLLKPTGYCIIRIPTVSSYTWGHYKVNWVGLDAPRHFFLHSLKSTKLLCDRANLTIENISFDSSGFSFWGSEQYLRDMPLLHKHSYWVNPQGSIFTDKEIQEFHTRAHELNLAKQGDQAVFTLRKVTL
jgi:2-polyprenyl-3-methyl-5-hydroxy-6-metoxy-1,4-benzoquinol methylase